MFSSCCAELTGWKLCFIRLSLGLMTSPVISKFPVTDKASVGLSLFIPTYKKLISCGCTVKYLSKVEYTGVPIRLPRAARSPRLQCSTIISSYLLLGSVHRSRIVTWVLTSHNNLHRLLGNNSEPIFVVFSFGLQTNYNLEVCRVHQSKTFYMV